MFISKDETNFSPWENVRTKTEAIWKYKYTIFGSVHWKGYAASDIDSTERKREK